MKLESCGLSVTGHIREQNEDVILLDDAAGLWLVADGMGGHACGEIASRITARTVAQSVAAGVPLDKAILQAHKAVQQEAAGDPQAAGMGTTVIAMQHRAQSNQIQFAWVGDSRLYRWRQRQLQVLSRDHSYLEWLRDNGVPVEEAHHHPKRNIITQSVGVGEPVPDMQSQTCRVGDRYVLCSDGLNDELTDAQIASVLAAEHSVQETAEGLLQAALAAGGHDNISLIVLEVQAAATPGRGDGWLQQWWQRLRS